MKQHLWMGLVIIVVFSLVVAACGAEPAAPASGSRPPLPAAPTPVPAPAFRASGEGANQTTTDSTLSSVSTPSTDRLIIKTANLSIRVRNVQDGVSAVSNIAVGLAGYVQSTNLRLEGTKLVATVTLKVPAERYEQALNQIRQLATKVEAESSTGQDVTEEYTDLNAQLKNLQNTEAQLNQFLTKTTNVDEALKVYRELNNIRSQIERIQGRMSYLEKSAAMSTITVNLRQEEQEQPITETTFDPLRSARDALRALWGALQGIFNALIWLVLFLVPVLLVLGVLVFTPLWLIWAFWRWTRRRRTPPVA